MSAEPNADDVLRGISVLEDLVEGADFIRHKPVHLGLQSINRLLQRIKGGECARVCALNEQGGCGRMFEG